MFAVMQRIARVCQRQLILVTLSLTLVCIRLNPLPLFRRPIRMFPKDHTEEIYFKAFGV